MTVTAGTGCWSGLRALVKGRKSTREHNTTEQNTTRQSSLLKKLNDHPPAYDSHKADNANATHLSGYCNWSTLEQKPVLGCVGELKLPSREAADTSDHTIDGLSSALREVSLKIHDHPELGWNVGYAHDILTDFLEEQGFAVTRNYLADKLPGNTAWTGEFTVPSQDGFPPRVIGFNSEMDALPGVGHACGHNLIAVVGVAAALGLKRAMEEHQIPGKIVILGTPAEESGAGKQALLEAGAYKEMDVCMMAHPSGGDHHNTVWTGGTLALQSFSVEYHGQNAHAGLAPWEGKNALDAAFIAYAAISALRQQIHPTMRVHGMIEGHDWAPNIIQDYAKMTYYVRAPTWREVAALRARLDKCFEAGALATSCTMTTIEQDSIKDLQQNTLLSDDFGAVMASRHGRSLILSSGAIGASTDFGNVTYELPAIHPGFSIPTTANGGNHTPPFTAAARTKEAHENAMAVSKALATVSLRVLLDGEFYQAVKAAFKKQFPQ